MQILKRTGLLFGAIVLLAGCSGGGMMNKPFLDPQMSWPYQATKFAGQEGKFYLNGQNENIVTVFDASSQKQMKIVNFREYEIAQAKKDGGKVDAKKLDFITKNALPHHSWVVPGGRYNYISNTAKNYDRIWVLDTWTDEIIGHMDTGGNGPLHMSFSPFKDIAVVGAVQDKKNGRATFLDTKNHKVLGFAKTTGTRTRDSVFTPDGKHVYITNQGYAPDKGNDGKVDMIDIATMKVVKSFDIPASKGMKMTYDGKIAGVTMQKKGMVAFIDAVTHKIIAKVKVGGQPNNISFNPSNTKAYTGLYKTNEFVVIDMATMKVISRIKGGKKANAVYFPPGNGNIAIGTNEADSFVTIIDGNTNKKIKDVDTPPGAHNVAFTPDGKVALITCKKSREAVFFDVEKMEEIEVVSKAGHGNNGVRWFPYGPGRTPAKPYL